MYVVISVEHNDALFFLFTGIATPLPVNNRGGRNYVCMQKTHQTERQNERVYIWR
jgi:hypothetical protein